VERWYLSIVSFFKNWSRDDCDLRRLIIGSRVLLKCGMHACGCVGQSACMLSTHWNVELQCIEVFGENTALECAVAMTTNAPTRHS
jgi:hypothetical protein